MPKPKKKRTSREIVTKTCANPECKKEFETPWTWVQYCCKACQRKMHNFQKYEMRHKHDVQQSDGGEWIGCFLDRGYTAFKAVEMGHYRRQHRESAWLYQTT